MTHIQRSRTMQTATTAMPADQVLAGARDFFGRQSGIYAAFVEQEGPTHVTLRGMGGEEVVVAVARKGDATAVTASSYLFDQQVAMFLASLPPAAGGASSSAAATSAGAKS